MDCKAEFSYACDNEDQCYGEPSVKRLQRTKQIAATEAKPCRRTKTWCKMDKAVIILACILADHTEVGAGLPELRFYE